MGRINTVSHRGKEKKKQTNQMKKFIPHLWSKKVRSELAESFIQAPSLAGTRSALKEECQTTFQKTRMVAENLSRAGRSQGNFMGAGRAAKRHLHNSALHCVLVLSFFPDTCACFILEVPGEAAGLDRFGRGQVMCPVSSSFLRSFKAPPDYTVLYLQQQEAEPHHKKNPFPTTHHGFRIS